MAQMTENGVGNISAEITDVFNGDTSDNNEAYTVFMQLYNSAHPEDIVTNLYFYGGNVNYSSGGIFGQGTKSNYIGSSKITLNGIFTMTGSVYGGANATTTGNAMTTVYGNGYALYISTGSMTIS